MISRRFGSGASASIFLVCSALMQKTFPVFLLDICIALVPRGSSDFEPEPLKYERTWGNRSWRAPRSFLRVYS